MNTLTDTRFLMGLALGFALCYVYRARATNR